MWNVLKYEIWNVSQPRMDAVNALVGGGFAPLAAMITRTILEPRFYGSHLGLDPLVMLIFLYFGYRLWGFLGIVISPLLAATTKALTANKDTGQ